MGIPLIPTSITLLSKGLGLFLFQRKKKFFLEGRKIVTMCVLANVYAELSSPMRVFPHSNSEEMSSWHRVVLCTRCSLLARISAGAGRSSYDLFVQCMHEAEVTDLILGFARIREECRTETHRGPVHVETPRWHPCWGDSLVPAGSSSNLLVNTRVVFC